MDKKYFYLDAARREPKGPCTLEELSAMMMAGTLTPATEVAAEGDAAWKPLHALLSEHGPFCKVPPVPNAAPPVGMPPVPQTAPPAAPQMDPGACPDCATPLETQDGMLPPRCPSCGRLLRPEKDTLWANAMMALRQYATLSGRATRKEYWSFALCQFLYYMVLLALFIASLVWLFSSMPQGSASLWRMEEPDTVLPVIACCAVAAIYVLSALALIIPNWCVTVRRLHDIGQSGFWALAQIILATLSLATTALVLAQAFGSAASGFADAESAARSIQEIEAQIHIGKVAAFGIVGNLCDLASNIVGLVIFVMMFLGSKRGPNRYGPSRNYPRG